MIRELKTIFWLVLYIVLIILLRVPVVGSSYGNELPLQKASPLSDLEIFTQGSLGCFAWRMENLAARSYDYWYDTIDQSNGFAPKMFAEEVTSWAPTVRERINRYAQERPCQLLLCHFNGRDTKLQHFEAASQFFPGHWAYLSGAKLVQDVDRRDTELVVSDGKYFRAPNPDGIGNDVIVIVPVNEDGNKLWDQAEFALVRAIDRDRLTVQRAQFTTQAGIFEDGSYVAPLWNRSGYQENDTYFRYNLAACCPRDNRGRTCGDLLVALFRQWFDTGGPLERVHGIAFDVLFDDQGGPLSVGDNQRRKLDTDVDGIADNGFDKYGKNLWALGVHDFNWKLRKALGPNRLITGDSNGSRWPCPVGLWNGMESESLTRWNDPYAREWSSNLNLFLHWKQWSPFAYQLSFIVKKFPTLDDSTPPRIQRDLVSLTYATAAILDIYATAGGPSKAEPGRRYSLYDELQMGVRGIMNWMGQPIGPIIRPAKDSPDVLRGSGVVLEPSFVNAWLSPDHSCRISRQADYLLVEGRPVSHTSSESMTLTYSNLAIGTGDLFFRFQVRADKLTHFPADVPRYLTVTAERRLPSEETADQLQAMATDAGYTEVCFFYRAAGPATVDIIITFEGRQDAAIKDFTVHQATDVIAREFENSVVLANPSEKPYTFDLAGLLPELTLKRLQGNTWDDPLTNNGTLVGPTVALPARAGLFLIKERQR